MQRDLVSGILLITGSLAMLVVMSLHPTAHDLMTPGNLERQADRSTMVHGLALASVPILFLGLLGLPRRLGRSDLTTAALVAWGFGGVAVTSAAVASGFVATPIIHRMLGAEGGSGDVYRALLTYTGLVNQGYAKVNVVADSVAILVWSAAIFRSRRMPVAVGVAGVLIGSAILFGLFSGHLRLDVHGFGIVTLAQSGWLIWLGVLLCREEGPEERSAPPL